jgi:hypothetical protein
MRSVLILSLLAAGSAHAAALVVVAPAGIHLKDAEVAPCADADVCFEGGQVKARFGIRLESRPSDFVAAAPLMIDEPFLAKGPSGNSFRFWIRRVVENRVFVEVEHSDAPPHRPAAAAPFAGRFKVERATIGGELTDPRYPDLTLESDGTFKMGSTHGLWNLTGGKVVLSGHFDAWGAAQAEGDTLTFRFQRGALDHELVFSRASGAAPTISAR